MGRIKGAALREFLLHLERALPEGELERRLQSVPEARLEALDISKTRVGVLASSWYPAPSIHAVLDAVFEGVEEARRAELIREGADAVMTATLHGVYKFFFRTLMSPDRYAKHAQKLWERFYDQGEVTKLELGPESQGTEIRNWASHHRVLCDLNYEAASYIYRAMGLEEVHAERQSCVSEGGELCAFTIDWRAD